MKPLTIDSARVNGQDRKKLPALRTNQIAEFGGFRPPARKLRKKYFNHLEPIDKYVHTPP